MNDQPLPPEHGAPLRVVVPGYIGARSVKWLERIVLLSAPSTNPFHTHAYRLLGSTNEPTELDWESAPALGELSVNSCICSLYGVPQGVLARGYATAGGDRTVVRVEVGRGEPLRWVPAELEDPPAPGVWRRWRVLLPELFTGELVCVRAWDSAANTQPERPENIWNVKGYMNNAWHRVRYNLPSEDVPAPREPEDWEV
jgi:sulfite oxidase